MCLEQIQMKFLIDSHHHTKVMTTRKLPIEICLVRSYVFYHIDNQLKIIVVYI